MYVCTFSGLAPMYIEATTEAEAVEKAWLRLFESNNAPLNNKITVTQI